MNKKNSAIARFAERIFSGKKMRTKKNLTSQTGMTPTTTNTNDINLTRSIEVLHDPDAYKKATNELPKEIDGRTEYDKDPTRYGDWEKNGRCIDF